ncbi:DUF305 domain-containing protein [Kribbella sp. GL6]|uniref:DUF305 domain-containing protein n=1 Tax=Kribbella sp. GL6 TaxID=3419765 RepID=UPI003CFFCF0C
MTFATQMVLHHQLAVRMVSTADFQATNPAVKTIAAQVKAANERELKQLTAWLVGWGVAVPSPSHGEDHADEIPGMMTEDDWSKLGNAEGAKFDRLWIQLMIKHHQGAIAMAKIERSTGKDARVKAFATSQTTQSAEMTAMQSLLKRLPG